MSEQTYSIGFVRWLPVLRRPEDRLSSPQLIFPSIFCIEIRYLAGAAFAFCERFASPGAVAFLPCNLEISLLNGHFGGTSLAAVA